MLEPNPPNVASDTEWKSGYFWCEVVPSRLQDGLCPCPAGWPWDLCNEFVGHTLPFRVVGKTLKVIEVGTKRSTLEVLDLRLKLLDFSKGTY